MTDIFISYAREDRPRVERLAAALEQRGWSVWWDPDIRTGEDLGHRIHTALQAAGCVIVVWSHQSIASPWVKDEAQVGQERGVLLPVCIDAVAPPLGFRQLQTVDLTGWRPGSPGAAFAKLVADIATMLGERLGHAYKGPSVPPDASQRRPSARLRFGLEFLLKKFVSRGQRPSRQTSQVSEPAPPLPFDRVAEVSSKTYDVFISHASEDKIQVALPVADYLERQGFRVWLDIFELQVGDSLRRSIDHGLSASKFGVVILSPAFFGKVWTNEELDGLVARQDGKHKVILPVWHHVSQAYILSYSPMLAGKVGVSTAEGLEHVANAIVRAIVQSSSEHTPSPLRRVPLEVQRDKELSDLRMQMLAARSSRELQLVEYMVDEFLTRYPNHPDARLLKMTIADSTKPHVSYAPPRSSALGCLIFIAVLLGIAAIVWWLFAR